ncbi:hypothetical protein RJ639_024041 [Escallonia herrerae]|uniref:Uncharacterized protein n=1 Tax=Escallonia herrerae TaxID=1293975 RepID=A0AA88UYY8_9ASTE|nr:hypothetical protein RJ639_024041 [Escallonia herrerae]
MSFFKPQPSRYNSFDSRSSTQSDPSSSTADLKSSNRPATTGSAGHHRQSPVLPSTALAKTKQPAKNDQNLTAMVKKFMDKRSVTKSKAKSGGGLVIATDFIAEDLRKNGRGKGTNFAGLHKKLFGRSENSGGKALVEVKANTRTLAMVLRSERELLIIAAGLQVEKLKDLCLKQREEIKQLKSAVLFPDTINSQLQELLEKQGSELNQAKQLIPNLQQQVTSLTGQLQCIAEDLAEVKADKFSVGGCFDGNVDSPRTPTNDQEDAANSLEFSSEDYTTPGSPDDMLIKDLNPCLTPYCAKTKSEEFEINQYYSLHDERLARNNMPLSHKTGFDSRSRKMSRSSDHCECSDSVTVRAACRSDGTKYRYGKQTLHKLI